MDKTMYDGFNYLSGKKQGKNSQKQKHSEKYPDIRDLYWDNDREFVKLNGAKYQIKCESYNAICPYAHGAFNVDLVPVNQNTESYKKMRDQLGGSWVTDGLSLEGKEYTQVYSQLLKMR